MYSKIYQEYNRNKLKKINYKINQHIIISIISNYQIILR